MADSALTGEVTDSWAWGIGPAVIWLRLDYIQFILHLVQDVLSLTHRYRASHVAIKKTEWSLISLNANGSSNKSFFLLMLLQICCRDDEMRHTPTSQRSFQHRNHGSMTSAAYCSSSGRIELPSVWAQCAICPYNTAFGKFCTGGKVALFGELVWRRDAHCCCRFLNSGLHWKKHNVPRCWAGTSRPFLHFSAKKSWLHSWHTWWKNVLKLYFLENGLKVKYPKIFLSLMLLFIDSIRNLSLRQCRLTGMVRWLVHALG